MEMINRRCSPAIALLIVLSLAGSGRGQESTQPKSPAKTLTAAAAKAATDMSPQEKLVRETYQKLSAYNRAWLLDKDAWSKEPVDVEAGLKFELSDFRVGPITEVLRTRSHELSTLPSGEIIQLSHSVSRHNKGEEKGEELVSYGAQWTAGQYSTFYDRNWTIGDLFNFEPNKYYDVGQYASYVVTVSFQGKSRTYRAMAIFHHPHGSVESLKPEIWDTIVGMGGVLTGVWKEKRPILKPTISRPARKITVAPDDNAAPPGSGDR